MADDETDIVPAGRGQETNGSDDSDIELTCAGVNTGDDQDALPRDWRAEALDEHQAKHREITVVRQQGRQRGQYAG